MEKKYKNYQNRGMPKVKDTITVEIKSNSKRCEQLREKGLFFEAIADALDIDREDIEEIEEKN